MTPELLAWVASWMRAFACLEAAGGLLIRNAKLGADMLYRSALELQEQVEIIREPWESLAKLRHVGGNVRLGESRKNGAWADVRERLRAYTAWCLRQDLKYFGKTPEGKRTT